MEEAREHKVVDIWLLTLIFMNNESLQKSIEKLLKKKIIEGCFQEHMFDQCILGVNDLPKVSEHRNNNYTLGIFFWSFNLIAHQILALCLLLVYTRIILPHFCHYLHTCWPAKNNELRISASTFIYVFLKNPVMLFQDKK